MNLAGIHRQIERRNYADVVKECAALNRQLAQRDAVLWLILKRTGPQAIAAAELISLPSSAEVVCRDNDGGMGAVFEAVDADAIIGAANEFARNDNCGVEPGGSDGLITRPAGSLPDSATNVQEPPKGTDT